MVTHSTEEFSGQLDTRAPSTYMKSLLKTDSKTEKETSDLSHYQVVFHQDRAKQNRRSL